LPHFKTFTSTGVNSPPFSAEQKGSINISYACECPYPCHNPLSTPQLLLTSRGSFLLFK